MLVSARILGARCYVMHGPSSLGGIAKNMELTRLGPIAQELCALAASYGITLAWENVSYCLFNRPDFGLRLLDATHADDLRFTLDIKQAARSGYSPHAFIEAVGERIVNLHLCDYQRLPDGRSAPRMPGKGECDFDALRDALLGKGYRGPAFLEVYSDMYPRRGPSLGRASNLLIAALRHWVKRKTVQYGQAEGRRAGRWAGTRMRHGVNPCA